MRQPDRINIFFFFFFFPVFSKRRNLLMARFSSVQIATLLHWSEVVTCLYPRTRHVSHKPLFMALLLRKSYTNTFEGDSNAEVCLDASSCYGV
jgi:hypothetical protein